jgi:hypothetical protein
MSQAVRPFCVFCGGLRREPPGARQLRVNGEQVWLHLQCQAGYERAQEQEQEVMHEQTRA